MTPPPREWMNLERTYEGVFEVDIDWFMYARKGILPPRVIDVREPDEFTGALGHIAGAELVPLSDLAEVAASWPRGQPIVTVCRSGRRSITAAQQLEALGFELVASLRGGMLAWQQANG